MDIGAPVMTSRSPLIRRYRSHLIALEPRMMFDAAAAVAMQDAAADGAAAGRPDGSFEDAHRDAPGTRPGRPTPPIGAMRGRG